MRHLTAQELELVMGGFDTTSAGSTTVVTVWGHSGGGGDTWGSSSSYDPSWYATSEYDNGGGGSVEQTSDIVDKLLDLVSGHQNEVTKAADESEQKFKEKHTVDYDHLTPQHYTFESLFTARFYKDVTDGRVYMDRDGDGKIDGEAWINSQGQAVYDDDGDHVADGIFTGVVAA